MDSEQTPEKTRQEERLAAALRENLKRRKAQQRLRDAAAEPDVSHLPHDKDGD